MFIELRKDFLGHKAGARLEVADADAAGMIASATAKRVEGDPMGEIVARAMATATESIVGGIKGSVDAALKEFAAASQKSRKNAVPAIFGDGGGDPKHTFGAFLLAIHRNDRKALESMGSGWREWEDGVERKTAMSTQAAANGGFLVPTQFYDRLMQLVAERSTIRKKATVVTMTAREIEVPCLDHATAPAAGDTAYFGGLVARWTEEATSLNETEPNFKQVKLVNYELSGYSKISNSLLQDSGVGLDDLLMSLFARAIAWYEEYAFLRGNGAGKPLGVLNWPGLISTTRTTASQIKLADLANMYGRLLTPGDPDNVLWSMRNTAVPQLISMTGGDNVIFLKNDINRRIKWSILGFDAAVTEKLPALGTAGDVLLADWSHYLIGDRKAVEVAYSEHAAFTTNQSVWRFVSRVGGQPWLRDKVTLSDGTSTVGPFVVLS